MSQVPRAELDPRTFALPTDVGRDVSVANELANEHGRRLAFVPEVGWYLYDPGAHVWREDEHGAAVLRLASELPLAEGSERRARAAVALARDVLRVPFAEFAGHRACVLLADRTALDWSDGRVQPREPEPEDFFRYHLGASLADPHGNDGLADFLWQLVLDAMFLGREDERDWLQLFLGLALTDEAVPVAAYLYGSSGAGKGILTNTLRRVLGTLAVSAHQDLVTRHNRNSDYHVADLDGRRLALVNELPAGIRLDENNFKRLADVGTVTGRVVRQRPRQIPVTWKLLLTSNDLPSADDADRAVERRLALLHLDRPLADALWDLVQVRYETLTVADMTRNTDREGARSFRLRWPMPWFTSWPEMELENVVPELCAGACLRWLVGGLKRHLAGETPLDLPASVRARRAGYVAEQSPVAEFIEECLVRDDDARLANRELRDAYNAWADRVRVRPDQRLGVKGLPQALKRAGFDQSNSGGRYWSGLRLADPADQKTY